MIAVNSNAARISPRRFRAPSQREPTFCLQTMRSTQLELHLNASIEARPSLQSTTHDQFIDSWLGATTNIADIMRGRSCPSCAREIGPSMAHSRLSRYRCAEICSLANVHSQETSRRRSRDTHGSSRGLATRIMSKNSHRSSSCLPTQRPNPPRVALRESTI